MVIFTFANCKRLPEGYWHSLMWTWASITFRNPKPLIIAISSCWPAVERGARKRKGRRGEERRERRGEERTEERWAERREESGERREESREQRGEEQREERRGEKRGEERGERRAERGEEMLWGGYRQRFGKGTGGMQEGYRRYTGRLREVQYREEYGNSTGRVRGG